MMISDKLMVNHSLIASANMSKVNIWGYFQPHELMGPLDLCKRLHSCQKHASVTSVFCMYYVIVMFMGFVFILGPGPSLVPPGHTRPRSCPSLMYLIFFQTKSTKYRPDLAPEI